MFLPKINDIGLEIDHIDRNKHNNSAFNLRWVNKSVNTLNKLIPVIAQSNNYSTNEHHIVFNSHSYYVVIDKQDLKIRIKFDNIKDAIIERNKIIDKYNCSKNAL